METDTDLVPVPEAMRLLGLTIRQINHAYKLGLVHPEKRIGVRANLVRLSELQAARERIGPAGRPRKPTPAAQP